MRIWASKNLNAHALLAYFD